MNGDTIVCIALMFLGMLVLFCVPGSTIGMLMLFAGLLGLIVSGRNCGSQDH